MIMLKIIFSTNQCKNIKYLKTQQKFFKIEKHNGEIFLLWHVKVRNANKTRSQNIENNNKSRNKIPV